MEWDLKNWTDPATLRRGAAYVKRGAVGKCQVKEMPGGALQIEAEVEEGALAPVHVRLDWDGRQLAARCTCPMVAPCKHAMAVALAHLQAPEKKPAATSGGFAAGQEVLFYGLHVAAPPKRLEKVFKRNACAWLSLEKAIIMEDGVPSMPRPLPLWAKVPRAGLSDADAGILDIIEPYYRERNRDFSSSQAHGIPLLDEMVGPIFELLTRCPFLYGAGRTPIAIRPDQPVRDLSTPYESLWEVDGTLVAGKPGLLVGENPGWLQVKGAFRPLIEGPSEAREAGPEAPGPEGLPAEPNLHPEQSPVARLTLSEEGDRLIARLTFRYGTAAAVLPGDPRALVGGELDGEWGFWKRDPVAESALVARLAETSLESRGGGQYMAWGETALSFLMDEVPLLLRDGWELFGEERLQRHRVNRRQASVSISVSTGIDWFDLRTTVEIEGETIAWEALREALKRNSRFVRLGSGAFARLPEEWLLRQQQLAESLGFSAVGEENAFVQQLPRYLAPAAQELLATADTQHTDTDWRQFLLGLEAVEELPEVPTPEGFVGELRQYQAHGLSRLSFWREHGVHGILADDMGLGKTIQAIALLLSEHEAGRRGPSLLVAPTSVVYNWEQEIARFAPGLKVLVLHGADRHAHYEELPEADVVVTSYGLLQRDRAVLEEQPFHYVILDEAQKIKNPRSQAAKAACRINARHRLCLTGTPIENNLLEFWSLFHFLMPGLLGNERYFRSRYLRALPEETDQARERLRKLTRPFILRRLKGDVAQDLPPRTEIVAYCELGEEQRKLYEETLGAVRGQIFAEIRTRGFKRAHFHVLEGLLRLRQVVCDPKLVLRDEPRNVPSAKLEMFMDMLREMIAEGHRVLVFSQFVKMLAILREALEAEEIPYAYLDGQTKDRLERVQRFNASDTPVFLISLKAGGTGLNLTGADYVIHFDPWWNPAVEDQATDRAHRIGQTRHVFSYKLIAKDTVEEKVLGLQAQKRKMVLDVLGGSEMGSELTMEDLEYLLQ
ncbi:MAG TPA: SNF2-related protein [Oscillatoriaceae cyanobacterium]